MPSFYVTVREYIQSSFMLNFIFTVFTHHYFLLVILALTYVQDFNKNTDLSVTFLLPMAGKNITVKNKGLECIKGIIMFLYKICLAKKIMRKKSVLDIRISHLVVLGFVNAFGYILPTLFMLRRGAISIFEYLF